MDNIKPPSQQRLGMRLWRGVTLQLFLVAVLPLTLLLLAVTFGSLELHHEAMRSLVAERNLWAVQTAAANLENEILHRGSLLEVIANQGLPGSEQGNPFAGLEQSLAVFEGGAAAVTANGEVIAFTGGPAVQLLTQSQDWQALLDLNPQVPTGKAAFLPTLSLDDQLYLPVVVKTASGAAFVGLIIPEKLLEKGLSVVAQSETTTILVVDADHQTLFQTGVFSGGEDHVDHAGIQSALEGKGGIDHTQTSAGEHVVTSSPIRTVGWALLIEESWEDIASPLLRATQNAPIILIPVLGLSLLALWFGLRQIVQPIQALEGKAGDLAHGNFETIRQPVGGVPEIRQLQASLMVMATQLREAQNSLHSYIGAITASVEGERRSLARELHDETLQSLIALGQYTQYALHWNKDPKVAQTLEQVMNLTEQGMKNLRRLVQGLRPIYIEDLGLATALSMEAAQGNRPDGMKVHFHQEGIERRLKPEVEMALYRIAQEALNNVARHAGASNAWILLRFQHEALVMEIRDDGRGFNVPSDPLHFARLGHYGLLGLYERTELVRAKLEIESSPGQGTTVRVHVPETEQAGDPVI